MKERANPTLRFLDKTLGIPLVFFLSLFKRKKRPLPKNITSIALLKSAGIGDVALLTGPINDLKTHFPNATLTLFTGKSNAAMGQLIPNITVSPLPLTNPLKALRIIRQYPYDLFIDADPWPRINALLTFFSRSKATIGFKTPKQHRHALFDYPIVHQNTVHELNNLRALLTPLNVQTNTLPSLHFPATPTKKEIVLHLFSGGARAPLKAWSAKNWQKLAEALIDKGYTVVLTGGAKEGPALNALFEPLKKAPLKNVAGLSLKKTAALLKGATAVVSVDTGIAHLAAILGCKMVVLHGPTAPSRWGAQGPNVTHLTPPYTYWPCLSLGHEKTCTQNSCMQAISVDQVLNALAL